MKQPDKTITLDAAGQSFGRLASIVALNLQGKYRITYTRNNIPVTKVIVSNFAKVKFSGKKLSQKKYYRHSSYPGGLTVTTLQTSMQKNPSGLFRKTVENMLPKNRLRKKMLSHLSITL